MENQFNYGAKQFGTQKELFAFLFKNKKQLIAQKKAVTKFADCVTCEPVIMHDKPTKTEKADQPIEGVLPDTLRVGVIINTTNFMDCHDDVHIPGLWSKSLAENKMMMHVQEHEMEFEKIISDGKNLKAYTRNYTWEELGYKYPGVTEGLTFDSIIERKRNEFMLNQYKNGWVRNHSVGMRYVKFDLAMNDEDCPNEFAAWNLYYPQIANKERADEKGYFWYVIEAKCIEGSAVPMGSNSATPTMTVEEMPIEETKNEPPIEALPIEPEQSTHKSIDYNYLLTHLKN